MSSCTLQRYTRPVKDRQEIIRPVNLSLDEIRASWCELSALAALVPTGQAEGLHRLRSRLLDAIPPWRLPEVLDSLAEGATV